MIWSLEMWLEKAFLDKWGRYAASDFISEVIIDLNSCVIVWRKAVPKGISVYYSDWHCNNQKDVNDDLDESLSQLFSQLTWLR